MTRMAPGPSVARMLRSLLRYLGDAFMLQLLSGAYAGRPNVGEDNGLPGGMRLVGCSCHDTLLVISGHSGRSTRQSRLPLLC